MAGQRPLGSPHRAPARRSLEQAAGGVTSESAADHSSRLRKAAVCNFKKREDYIKLTRSASAGSPKTPESGIGSPTGQAARASAEANRPHSAPLVSRRKDKTADGKGFKTRHKGEEGSRRRQAAEHLASSRAGAATECFAGTRNALREDVDAQEKEQDLIEDLHRKLQSLQADIEARDLHLAERHAEFEKRGKKTKDLQLEVKHLREELRCPKPSEAEELAVAEKEEALERLLAQEKEAPMQNAQILEQSQSIKSLEGEVRQLKQQLEGGHTMEPDKTRKKNHRAKLKSRK